MLLLCQKNALGEHCLGITQKRRFSSWGGGKDPQAAVDNLIEKVRTRIGDTPQDIFRERKDTNTPVECDIPDILAPGKLEKPPNISIVAQIILTMRKETEIEEEQKQEGVKMDHTTEENAEAPGDGESKAAAKMPASTPTIALQGTDGEPEKADGKDSELEKTVEIGIGQGVKVEQPEMGEESTGKTANSTPPEDSHVGNEPENTNYLPSTILNAVSTPIHDAVESSTVEVPPDSILEAELQPTILHSAPDTENQESSGFLNLLTLVEEVQYIGDVTPANKDITQPSSKLQDATDEHGRKCSLEHDISTFEVISTAENSTKGNHNETAVPGLESDDFESWIYV